MSSSKAAASAVGGKAARACDSCLRRRARWYCAADDAFLCQGCDTSVHSANPLARRHERLRLASSSSSSSHPHSSLEASTAKKTKKRQQQVAPAWSKRKARTQRPHAKSVGQLLSRRLVVPEGGVESEEERKAEDDGAEEEEEQLLYRVPSFDRALAELCSPLPIDDAPAAAGSGSREDVVDGAVEKAKTPAAAPSPVQLLPVDNFASFGPTDAELREFAADMEALLGQGLDDGNELDESFYMESLGLMTPADDGGQVKMEPDGVTCDSKGLLGFGASKPKPEASAEVLSMDFNCSSPTALDVDEDDDSYEQKASASHGDAAGAQFLQRRLDLRLNHEAVIESWGGSPWTDGERPHVRLDDFWPDSYSPGLLMAGGGRRPGEESAVMMAPRWGTTTADGAREARVSRYREKRRTRLFAKKIRYEVRKLNAEKRPRMKGRFVKRPAAGGGAAPCAVT
ncbi:hypothetical protein ACP70R_026270 [Stipagrostis hirtigluma subsp. patula]